jgi:hypothetical protein
MRDVQYYLPFQKNRILCCIEGMYGLTYYWILVIFENKGYGIQI